MTRTVRICVSVACAVLAIAVCVTVLVTSRLPKDPEKPDATPSSGQQTSSGGEEPGKETDRENPLKPQPETGKPQPAQRCFAYEGSFLETGDPYTDEAVAGLDHYFYYKKNGEIHRVSVSLGVDLVLATLSLGENDRILMEYYTYENSRGDLVFPCASGDAAGSVLIEASTGRATWLKNRDALALANGFVVLSDVSGIPEARVPVDQRADRSLNLTGRREVYFFEEVHTALPRADRENLAEISCPVLTPDGTAYAEVYRYLVGDVMTETVMFTLIDGTDLVLTPSEPKVTTGYREGESEKLVIREISPEGGFVRTNFGIFYPEGTK